ncbi:MAG: hypothetical protein BWX92_03916 [Deltaproteobacteria bacterium ADurb.Bin135]|nr:MAG: hypothetical protein BWX92_03916 [Deltaproteobacteria bacterium ADurb.Bin135]
MVDTNTIVELYELGNSTYKISKVVGISPAAVYQRLKKAGVEMRSKKESLQYLVRYNTCVVCGKEFRARKAYNSGNLYRETCSDECLFEYKSQRSKEGWTEERKQHQSELFTGRDMSGWNMAKGEGNYSWKGGYSSRTYRRIAFEELGMEKVCEVCGTTKGLAIHHRDRDRTNNTRENLMVMCRSCHTKHHNDRKEIGVNCENGYNNRNKAGVKGGATP